MDRFLIDTNIWIEFFHQRNGVKEHIEALNIDQIYASEVTLAELTYGAMNSSDYERHIKEPQWLKANINICDISEVFNEYAQVRRALHMKKLDRIIGNFDILIGATALHFGLTVVTDNVRHFQEMPGVKVVNWVNRTTE